MLGAAFGFGWAPCIGPVQASILVLAGATQTVAWGAILLALYGLGLGIPFVVVALWYQRASRSVAWLRRNSRRIEVVGGVLLVGVGVMFVFGAWRALFIPLQRTFTRLGWPPL
jgi:cytochrome c-type biogenesis protein